MGSRVFSIRILALLLFMFPLRSHAQAIQQSFAGGLASQYAGRAVFGAGRLLATGSDPATQIVVGRTGAWLLNSRSCLRSLAAPAGSSATFGTAAALVPGYRAPDADVLAIGDPGANAGAGQVALYFGGATIDSLPSLVLHGLAAGDLFGAAIASVGDLDGDGYGDVVVGAPGRNSGAGAVFVFRGGASPAGSPFATLDGGAGALFGSALAGAGDLDADGAPEYVVGAPGAQSGAGSVTLVLSGGRPAIEVASPLGVPAYGARPRFGASLAVSDLTGDGAPDLAVGAPGAALGRGSICVFPGASGSFAAAGPPLVGDERQDHLGAAVLLAPLRTAGVADLAAASPGAAGGRGAVGVYFGGPSFDFVPDLLTSGGQADARFGSSLGAAALYPQAPAKQLLVGAPFADGAALSAGASFVFVPPNATAVETAALGVESDGLTLLPGQFTSAEPRILVRLSGADVVDLAACEVTIDGERQALELVPAKPASATGRDASPSAGVALHPTALVDGRHLLVAHLLSADQTRQGTTRLEFTSAASLRLSAVRATPNPARGAIQLGFELTRPAAFECSIFDLGGRRVSEVKRPAGVPGANELRIERTDEGDPLRPGVYFYVLSARYGGRSIDVRGRVVLLN